jgi:methyl-accepting chemotaxis protein
MKTTVATALARGNAGQAAASLAASIRADIERPALAIVFASTAQPLEAMMAGIAKAFPDTVLIGTSTAGEFTEQEEANGSASMFAVAGDYRAHVGIGVGLKANTERAIIDCVAGLPKTMDGFPHRTAIVLIDGLAGVGEEATLLAATHLGTDVQIAGASAADDWQVKNTFVAAGTRVSSDAVAIMMIYSKERLGVGVAHGHEPFTDEVRVTRAEGSVVYEIDGRPAWDVWREKTRDEALKDGVDPDKLASAGETLQFFARFEAGIETGDAYKIRPPFLRLPEGALAFSCGIPQGTPMRLMRSSPDRQLASARQAARRAKESFGARAIMGAVVFDCACRKVLLTDNFFSAVQSVSEELGGVKVAGFESYGEIALNQGDWSGFHNATTVLLAF